MQRRGIFVAMALSICVGALASSHLPSIAQPAYFQCLPEEFLGFSQYRKDLDQKANAANAMLFPAMFDALAFQEGRAPLDQVTKALDRLNGPTGHFQQAFSIYERGLMKAARACPREANTELERIRDLWGRFSAGSQSIIDTVYGKLLPNGKLLPK